MMWFLEACDILNFKSDIFDEVISLTAYLLVNPRTSFITEPNDKFLESIYFIKSQILCYVTEDI